MLRFQFSVLTGFFNKSIALCPLEANHNMKSSQLFVDYKKDKALFGCHFSISAWSPFGNVISLAPAFASVCKRIRIEIK